MPPRLPTQSFQQVARCSSNSSGSSATATATASASLARLPPAAERLRASFATTSSRGEMTRLRTKMFTSLEKLEKSLMKSGPHYAGGELQPFPDNAHFKSQPVLDEESRERIWRRVVQDGEALKVVSADMGVDIRRVAAVVRMKQIEKQWVREGKALAKPYARAMMEMLPTTDYNRGGKVVHEPLNDVHVHSYTMQQVFMPTSESRRFTRYDAAKAFHRDLLPAEKRTMHKELIEMERAKLAGADRRESYLNFQTKTKETEEQWAKRAAMAIEVDEARTVKVQSDRFEFRFKNFNSEDVGRHGRKRQAVGWRYGAPLDDRKRGKVKIPTKMP